MINASTVFRNIVKNTVMVLESEMYRVAIRDYVDDVLACAKNKEIRFAANECWALKKLDKSPFMHKKFRQEVTKYIKTLNTTDYYFYVVPRKFELNNAIVSAIPREKTTLYRVRDYFVYSRN